MGNVNPPKHGTSQTAQQFADKAAELSGGKVKIAHHHSGALGGEREVAQQIQLGAVDFGPITTAPLSTLIPEMSVFQLPYIFRDYAHVFKALDDSKAQHERALAVVHGEVVRIKAVADAEHAKAISALNAEHERQRKEAGAEQVRIAGELTAERDELRRGLSSARDNLKRNETELASAVHTIADRNAELRAHGGAIAERDQRIAELRHEIATLEQESLNKKGTTDAA